MNLRGKNFLLGLSGSISAYKACDLLQQLKTEGAQVRILMTYGATQFVTPQTFAALSGIQPLYRINQNDYFEESSCYGLEESEELHSLSIENGETNGMEHIEWAKWADLFIIAPCTANLIGELANGLTHSSVSLVYMCFEGPVYIAPAMNTKMLGTPAFQCNLELLKKKGDYILPTGYGLLACGEQGYGKMLDTPTIVEFVKAGESLTSLHPKLKGKRCLLAVGHTQEKIDDIRFISNRSSGKTGFAIVWALQLCGAKVSVVCGNLDMEMSNQFADSSYLTGYEEATDVTRVSTTEGFRKTLLKKQSNYDAIVMSCALADAIPVHTQSGKIKNYKDNSFIGLKPAPHILNELIENKKENQVIVGFALENEKEEKEAFKKWNTTPSDILIINTPVVQNTAHSKVSENSVLTFNNEGFGKEKVRALAIDQLSLEDEMNLSLISKYELADHLLVCLDKFFK